MERCRSCETSPCVESDNRKLSEGSWGRNWLWIYGTACIVGLLAFLADYPAGVLGGVVTALASSGVSWGAAAVSVGYLRNNFRTAVLSGILVLVTSTFVYYALILFVSRRWSSGTLDDGSPASSAGLVSVGTALAFWVCVSLFVGPILAALGYAVRWGNPMQSGFTIGLVFGLLSSQGWHVLYFQRIWMTRDEFGVTVLAGALTLLALSALIGVLLIWKRGIAGRHLVIAVVMAAASSVVFALGWRMVELIRPTIQI